MMKNRFLGMKMGSRTRPDYPRPRKTWKTDRKPRKTRKFENLGSADGAKPLVLIQPSGTVQPESFAPVPEKPLAAAGSSHGFAAAPLWRSADSAAASGRFAGWMPPVLVGKIAPAEQGFAARFALVLIGILGFSCVF